MIATLIACAVLFGTGTGLSNVTTPEVLLLGIGTTASAPRSFRTRLAR